MRTIVLALLVSLAAHAETIDRIAVSVGNRVITTSDIERQIRVVAFINGAKPDLSAKARREAAERLIDQKLVQAEMETARYPEPSPAEVDAALNDFKAKYYPKAEDYNRALAEYGITEQDLKEQLHWQRRWAAFVGVRFRPEAAVSERDIADYFDKTVAPAARAANPSATVSIEEFHDRIAEKLAGDRADRQLIEWLAETRKRADIVFHPEAFE